MQEEEGIELRIFNRDDRKTVASILFDNGYTVRQGKRKRSESGKSYDYLIYITDRKGDVSDK